MSEILHHLSLDTGACGFEEKGSSSCILLRLFYHGEQNKNISCSCKILQVWQEGSIPVFKITPLVRTV